MKSIKHIVWDWNGTLFDDASACVETLNVFLKERSLPKVNIVQYREHFGFPVKKYYEFLGFDFSAEDWDVMARRFHDLYLEKSRRKKLRSGAIAVLRALKKQNMPMSVLSASEVSLLGKFLRAKGIRQYFENIYGLTDLYADSKLTAGRKLILLLSVPPSEILLVGDTVHDYEIAKKTGCRCVLLANGHQAEHRIRKCGCPLLTDIKFLPGFIKNNCEQL